MTTNSDVWDDFSMPNSGDFPDAFKFDEIGAAIAGTIINIRRAEFDGRGIPELWITTDDGDRSVLCGQANLMTQLLELRPNVGDRIAILYASTRKAKLGQAKIFDVSLKRADGTTTEPAAAPAGKTAADLL
jgi:hypothetical protein